MKSPEEKKTRSVPTRMTQGQYKAIKQMADERNMSVSSFMVTAAKHSEQQLTPHQLLQLQELVNMAAEACRNENPELAAKIEAEGDALWSWLR